MARIFAYILHKGGVVDDSAAELIAAAKAIDPASSPTAILAGWGPDFDLSVQFLDCLLQRCLESRKSSARVPERRTCSSGASKRTTAGQHRARPA